MTQPSWSHPVATSGPEPSQIDFSPTTTYAPNRAPSPTNPVPETVNVFSTAGSTGADGDTVTVGAGSGAGAVTVSVVLPVTPSSDVTTTG
ncbi:hypothetical protein ACWFQT_20770, partial [Cellulosimicrobium cellulans]